MKTPCLTLAAFLATAVPWMVPTIAEPDPQPPAERRERVERLQEQARELKAAGRHDEALRVMREADELQAQPIERPRPALPEARRAAVRARIEALRNEGREREAAELKERLGQAERQGDRPFRARVGRPEPDRPGQPTPPPMLRERFERRMHHFELALENLRAAGLPELAERLAGERERVADRFRAGMERGAPVPQEVESMRAELNELGQAVRELRARVEELQRDRPRP